MNMSNMNSPQLQRRKHFVSSPLLPARVAHSAPRPASNTGQGEHERRVGHSLEHLPIFPARASSLKDTLQQAIGEGGSALDSTVSSSLGERLDHDFKRVRVHGGPSSAQAAKQLGARAFTLGNDIFLGAKAHGLRGVAREQLLTHEAVHTAQQGGSGAIPWERLAVSTPADNAEVEARSIASSLMKAPPMPERVRDQVGAAPDTRQTIAQVSTPLIQRDIDGAQDLGQGVFSIHFEPYKVNATTTVPEESGMIGDVQFEPADTSPPAKSIKFIQTVRLEDLDTGREYQWTGGEAPRMAVMTAASKAPKVEEGHFIDTYYDGLTPRATPNDPEVSPYYTDSPPGITTGYSGQAGYHKTRTSKKTGRITHQTKTVILHDEPACEHRARFSFETVARAADGRSRHVYGSVQWGFTVDDVARSTITEAKATFKKGRTTTFNRALTNFNRRYNP
jgi:Domain of unknown function (DUF4157)